jgi:hypothetical protein
MSRVGPDDRISPKQIFCSRIAMSKAYRGEITPYNGCIRRRGGEGRFQTGFRAFVNFGGVRVTRRSRARCLISKTTKPNLFECSAAPASNLRRRLRIPLQAGVKAPRMNRGEVKTGSALQVDAVGQENCLSDFAHSFASLA